MQMIARLGSGVVGHVQIYVANRLYVDEFLNLYLDADGYVDHSSDVRIYSIGGNRY